VTQNGCTIEYASVYLQHDRNIVSAAMTQEQGVMLQQPDENEYCMCVGTTSPFSSWESVKEFDRFWQKDELEF